METGPQTKVGGGGGGEREPPSAPAGGEEGDFLCTFFTFKIFVNALNVSTRVVLLRN